MSGEAGKRKGAVRTGVRAAPQEAERTEPHLVEILERARVGAEVLRPLAVQDRGQHAVAQASGEFPGVTHHLQPPFGFDFEPKQALRQFRRKIPSVSRVERRRTRARVTALFDGEGGLLAPATGLWVGT